MSDAVHMLMMICHAPPVSAPLSGSKRKATQQKDIDENTPPDNQPLSHEDPPKRSCLEYPDPDLSPELSPASAASSSPASLDPSTILELVSSHAHLTLQELCQQLSTRLHIKEQTLRPRLNTMMEQLQMDGMLYMMGDSYHAL